MLPCHQGLQLSSYPSLIAALGRVASLGLAAPLSASQAAWGTSRGATAVTSAVLSNNSIPPYAADALNPGPSFQAAQAVAPDTSPTSHPAVQGDGVSLMTLGHAGAGPPLVPPGSRAGQSITARHSSWYNREHQAWHRSAPAQPLLPTGDTLYYTGNSYTAPGTCQVGAQQIPFPSSSYHHPSSPLCTSQSYTNMGNSAMSWCRSPMYSNQLPFPSNSFINSLSNPTRSGQCSLRHTAPSSRSFASGTHGPVKSRQQEAPALSPVQVAIVQGVARFNSLQAGTPVERVSTDTLSRLVEGATAGDVAEMIELVTQQVPARTASHVFSLRTHVARMQSHGFNRYGRDPTGSHIPEPASLAEVQYQVKRGSTGGGPAAASTPTGSSTTSDGQGGHTTVLVRGYQQAMQTAQVHVHPDLGFSETGPPTVKLPQVPPLSFAGAATVVAEVKEATCHVEHASAAPHRTALAEILEAAAARRMAAAARFSAQVASARVPSFVGAISPAPTQGDTQQSTQGTAPSQSPSSAHALQVMQAISDLRDHMEFESEKLAAEIMRASEAPSWWSHSHIVQCMDLCMASHTQYLLSMRVLLSEALCVWQRHRLSLGLKGLGLSGEKLVTEEEARWSMAGPRRPPGSEDAATRPAPSLLLRSAPLRTLLELATEDTRAFCVEKNSVAPQVEVVGREECQPTIMDAYVTYIYSEVLKNSMSALIRKWGAWDVDEADPIRVEIHGPYTMPDAPPDGTSDAPQAGQEGPGEQGGRPSRSPGKERRWFTIQVTDTGGGMEPSQLEHSLHFFASSHNDQAANQYWGYSRDHGAQFQGQGVGMSASRCYAAFMGGAMHWESDRESGTTTATLTLPYDGFEF